MRKIWFFSLLGLLGSLSSSASPLINFQFLREQCTTGRYSDSSSNNFVGDIILDTSYVSCPNSNGLKSSSGNTCSTVPATSELTVTSIASRLSETSGYTVEVWAQADVSPTNSLTDTFMSVMPVGATSKSTVCAAGGDMAVGIGKPTSLTVDSLFSQTSVSSGSETCNAQKRTATFTPTSVHHYVYRVYNNETNGKLVVSSFLDGADLSSTSTALSAYRPGFMDPNNKLFVSSAGGSQAWACTFQGTIYQLTMYDYFLTQAEISANYAAKIANSLPVATTTTVTVPEDGKDAVDVASQTDYFDVFAPSEVYSVSCPYYDFDEDATSFTYNAANPTALCRITSLPDSSDAELFTMSGQAITVNHTIAVSDNVSFRVRPAFNRNGYTFQIDFSIIDGVDAREDKGVLTFSVTAVNDPPVAIATNGSVYSRVAKCIQLQSSDVDTTLAQRKFYVESLPAHGELYHCDSSGTSTTTQIDAAGTLLTNSYIGYVYTGDESGGATELGYDQMNFIASDGQFNSTSSVTFAVYSRFVAEPTYEEVDGDYVATSSTADDYTVNEGGVTSGGINKNITLYASDIAASAQEMHLYLETLPSIGSLWHNGVATSLNTPLNMTRVSSSKFSIDLEYISADNFFNTPTTTYYGVSLGTLQTPSFKYHVEVADSRSITATQGIVVKNLNTAMQVSWAEQVLKTKGSTILDRVYLNITGFSFTDFDEDVDLVHVEVACDYDCDLYISKKYPDSYDKCSSCPCYVSRSGTNGWLCNIDSSKGQSDLHFVATPSRAIELLNTMQFSITADNVIVPVTVTVYDGTYSGTGSDTKGCIWWSNVKNKYPAGDSTSARTACYSSSVSFNVTVESLINEDDTTSDVKASTTVKLIVYGLYALGIYFCLTVLYFIFRLLKAFCFGTICCVAKTAAAADAVADLAAANKPSTELPNRNSNRDSNGEATRNSSRVFRAGDGPSNV